MGTSQLRQALMARQTLLPHIPWNSDHGKVAELASQSNLNQELSEESHRPGRNTMILLDRLAPLLWQVLIDKWSSCSFIVIVNHNLRDPVQQVTCSVQRLGKKASPHLMHSAFRHKLLTVGDSPPN